MRGFSLMELLVTMAIAGLLAALALPGYTSVLQRATRQDARLALLLMQHREEIYFAKHLGYAGQADKDAALQDRSEQRHYLLELQVSADRMSYTALARADPAGRQAADSHCAVFTIDETGRRRTADAAGNWHDDDLYRCWG